MSGSEFLPPDRATLDGAREILTAGLSLDEHGEQGTDRTYYDTFDGLARAAGLSVVYERGRLSMVERDSGVEQAGARVPPPTGPLLAQELQRGPLKDALSEVIEVRALLPLVHVHSRVHALNLLDDAHKTVVRMTLEEPAVVDSGPRHIALRPRLRLAGVRGYDNELERLRAELEDRLGFTAVDQPLVDEAVRAAGGAPSGIPTKVTVPLSADQRADAAAAAVLRRLLEVIEATIDGTIADIDSEFLHDFRVSVRRSRSVQREFKRVFPPAELKHFRSEFKWLQQATGDARDLDVYVLEFDTMRELVPEWARADLDPLLAVLRARRLAAREQMARALRSERTTRLLRDWAALLEELAELPLEDRPHARRSIAELAARRIIKVYRRMLKMGDAITADSPPEAYHDLRKRGKELRYLLELFGSPLYPSEVVKPAIKSLKGLQDVLGRHQDREVQMAMLRDVRDEVAAEPGGPAAVMAMGVLVQRLLEDEQQARAEFARAFSGFAAGKRRRQMKGTFA
jgi:CHAD domain-containing protein